MLENIESVEWFLKYMQNAVDTKIPDAPAIADFSLLLKKLNGRCTWAKVSIDENKTGRILLPVMDENEEVGVIILHFYKGHYIGTQGGFPPYSLNQQLKLHMEPDDEIRQVLITILGDQEAN